MMNLRGWMMGLVAVGLGLGTLGAADSKELIGDVKKVSDLFEKKDNAGAKKAAEEFAKKKLGMDDLMHLFALRTKGGIGVGHKAGAVTPDGLEKKVMELAKKAMPEKQLADESQALAEMGYSIAALSEIAVAMAPAKDDGKKKKKDWITWSEEMRDASLALATAAKDKKPDDLRKAAKKTDDACVKCHDVFRE